MEKKKKRKETPMAFPIPHYVCTGGCKTVSKTAGKCHAAGCLRARNPYTECRCEDGTHGDLLLRNASGKSK